MIQQKDFLKIHAILCETYGAPFPYFSDEDPLGELIGTLLSHRTPNERTAAAFKKLKEKYPGWEDLRDGDTEELVQTIYSVTFPGQKARRIQEVLHLITEANEGELSLDFLKKMPPPEAKKWLEKLPGVGPKTSAAVLNFSSLRLPAMVIDSHHMRVAQRLDLVPEKASTAKAQKFIVSLIPDHWEARDYYDHHEALMYHGQKRCFPRNPGCENCPVKDYCIYA
jgi:endonuclease-3